MLVKFQEERDRLRHVIREQSTEMEICNMTWACIWNGDDEKLKRRVSKRKRKAENLWSKSITQSVEFDKLFSALNALKRLGVNVKGLLEEKQ